MTHPSEAQPTAPRPRKRKPATKNRDPQRAWRRVESVLARGPMIRGELTNKCSSYLDGAGISALVAEGKVLSYGRSPSYLCLPHHRELAERMSLTPTPPPAPVVQPKLTGSSVQAIMADLHMHRDNAKRALERAQRLVAQERERHEVVNAHERDHHREAQAKLVRDFEARMAKERERHEDTMLAAHQGEQEALRALSMAEVALSAIVGHTPKDDATKHAPEDAPKQEAPPAPVEVKAVTMLALGERISPTQEPAIGQAQRRGKPVEAKAEPVEINPAPKEDWTALLWAELERGPQTLNALAGKVGRSARTVGVVLELWRNERRIKLSRLRYEIIGQRPDAPLKPEPQDKVGDVMEVSVGGGKVVSYRLIVRDGSTVGWEIVGPASFVQWCERHREGVPGGAARFGNPYDLRAAFSRFDAGVA
jgi:hypothetical protein